MEVVTNYQEPICPPNKDRLLLARSNGYSVWRCLDRNASDTTDGTCPANMNAVTRNGRTVCQSGSNRGNPECPEDYSWVVSRNKCVKTEDSICPASLPNRRNLGNTNITSAEYCTGTSGPPGIAGVQSSSPPPGAGPASALTSSAAPATTTTSPITSQASTSAAAETAATLAGTTTPGTTPGTTTGTGTTTASPAFGTLDSTYQDQLAAYEAAIDTAIRDNSPSLLPEIRAKSEQIQTTLNRMIESLTYLKKDTPNIRAQRDELLEKLRRIQRDYNGLIQNTDDMETLRRIREQESEEGKRQLALYLAFFLLLAIVILLYILFMGQKKEATTSTPNTPAMSPALT